MTQALTTFFDAWSESDAGKRTQAVAAAIAHDGIYSDPRSGERLSSTEAIAKYVGMFCENAPGWTAKVVKSDEVNRYLRAVVAFGGKGPDGSDVVQHGTYFGEVNDAGKLIFLSGFVGIANAD